MSNVASIPLNPERAAVDGEAALAGTFIRKSADLAALPDGKYVFLVNEGLRDGTELVIASLADTRRGIVSHRSLVGLLRWAQRGVIVKGAGELEIKNGKIARLNNRSGTYPGTRDNLIAVRDMMARHFRSCMAGRVALDDYSRATKQHPLYVPNTLFDAQHTIGYVEALGKDAFTKLLRGKDAAASIGKALIAVRVGVSTSTLPIDALAKNPPKKTPAAKASDNLEANAPLAVVTAAAIKRSLVEANVDAMDIESFLRRNLRPEDGVKQPDGRLHYKLKLIAQDVQLEGGRGTRLLRAISTDNVERPTYAGGKYHHCSIGQLVQPLTGDRLQIRWQRGFLFVDFDPKTRQTEWRTSYYVGRVTKESGSFKLAGRTSRVA